MTKDSPDFVDIHVGQRLRSVRLERGLSQQTLGEAVGITFQQVQKYERGANRISASKLYAFAGVLACEVADFFDGLPKPGTGDVKPNQTAANALQIMAAPGGAQLVASYLHMAKAQQRPFVDLARSMVAV